MDDYSGRRRVLQQTLLVASLHARERRIAVGLLIIKTPTLVSCLLELMESSPGRQPVPTLGPIRPWDS